MVTAVVNACVLYPAALRDTLLSVAQTRVFAVRWTRQILDEMARNLLANNPHVTEAGVAYLVGQMQRAFPHSAVEEYEPLIAAMTNHEKDRHVLAAAVKAGANVIVTLNVKHFPRSACDLHRIEVHRPDEFLLYQLGLAPDLVYQAPQNQVSRLANPPRTFEDQLERMGPLLPSFIEAVRAFRAA